MNQTMEYIIEEIGQTQRRVIDSLSASAKYPLQTKKVLVSSLALHGRYVCSSKLKFGPQLGVIPDLYI